MVAATMLKLLTLNSRISLGLDMMRRTCNGGYLANTRHPVRRAREG